MDSLILSGYRAGLWGLVSNKTTFRVLWENQETTPRGAFHPTEYMIFSMLTRMLGAAPVFTSTFTINYPTYRTGAGDSLGCSGHGWRATASSATTGMCSSPCRGTCCGRGVLLSSVITPGASSRPSGWRLMMNVWLPSPHTPCL